MNGGQRFSSGAFVTVFLVACAPGGSGSGGGDDDDDDGAGFQRLWVPHHDAGELRGWDADRLAADVDGAADVVVTLPAGTRPNAVAFDDAGDLWVTDNDNNRLLRLAAADLSVSGAPVPAVVIDSDGASLQSPIGVLYDDAGGLWVAVSGAVEHYAADTLEGAGPTTPTTVLTHAGFDVPAGLLLDDDGDLWLTDAADVVADNAVMVFTPDQLAAGGEQTPRLTLTSAGFTLVEGLQFDDDGDLWVASNDGLAVSRLANSDVVLPAAPEVRAVEPSASLESDDNDGATGRTVRKPGGLLFDPAGNLFVNSERGEPGSDSSAVLRFSASQVNAVQGPTQVQADVVVVRATSNPGFGGMALQR